MQVLLYKCPDYTITIKTSDIVAAWNRFNSRVPESSRTYCTYASTHEADDLQLLKVADDGRTTAMESIGGGKEWEGQPPVLFETEIYHFFIEFNCPLLDTPRINHPKREIAECFDYHKGMLTGSINFLNNPGTFILSFSYVKADGEHVTDSLTLEVVSPKLDTKRDLDNIKRLINAEYENYVYEYLTLTFQNHEVVRSDKAESKIIWLSIFKQVIEPYFKACRYIMQHTNRKAQKRCDYARPERVKRWSRQEEERYEERGEDADRFYYRHELTEHTINTKENRFVKHTLIYLQKKFTAVFGELREAYENDLSEQAIEQMNEYESAFFEDFLNNRAEMYYTGTEDTKPNLDIQSIKYFMPLIKGKIDGVYKVSAINAARKRDKEINEKTSNDGVRFFLMLDEFIPFGESIDHRNTLHNGDWMTIEEARDKYKEFLHQLPQGHHHPRHGALPLETGV